MPKPLILLTAGRKTPTAPYERAIELAGARPVVRLPGQGLDVHDDVAGVIIAGGASVEPARYGSEIEAGVTPTMDLERDELEWAVLTHALSRGLPVLGICRGLQVINVYYGGELYQELSLTSYGDLHRPAEVRSYRAHTVRATGGRLAELLGTEAIWVNSIHRQGVKALGVGLVPSVRAQDGLVEGVETPDGQVIAVQWHPEELVADDPGAQALFADLVERCSVQTELAS